MADEPSRLLTGNIYYKGGYIPIEEYRNMIFSRSLYNLSNEYETTNLFSLNNRSEVASSIQTVLNVIPQYNRIQVNTNLAGNVYDAFKDDSSPLARIGLTMLGKQLAFNSAMNLSVKYLPSIDVSQALKGNMKGVFKRNVDNTISVKNADDKSFLDKVGSTASSVLGIDTYDVFGDANPFNKNPTNIDYIQNTGKGQLTHFYSAVNMNIYKPVNYVSNSAYGKVFLDNADEVGVKVDFPRNISVANRNFFTFNEAVFRPYWKNNINETAIEKANSAMRVSFTADTGVQEYAPYQAYIDKNFGDVKIVRDKTKLDYVDEESNIAKDGVNDKLIWGRDGLIPEAKDNIGLYRGDDDSISLDTPYDPAAKFNVKEGILEYTKNLLNATEGQFVDITKKVFKKDDTIVGFQGSPLWQAPEDSKYASDSGNAGKSGIRQHTILDPYDRFAKSIRFKGNVVYNGNQNSVINKTVLPRIHPTLENGEINSKNLMFSLENLAIGTIKREKYGVIDDEYATPIPLSEVGPFAGRIMWFPPYNLQINEVAMAKFESTVMVGRNEPMYNYMNSERTAVLSFSLLIDYPEQLRNLDLVGNNRNKAIADFFAFGGNPTPDEYTVEILEKKIEELKDSIPEIEGPDDQAEPADIKVDEVTAFFQNNKPTEAEVDTIFDIMYNNPEHYEILSSIQSAQDGNGFGYNNELYFIEKLTGVTNSGGDFIYTGVSGTSYQYSATGRTNQDNSVSLLNQNLLDVYSDENNRKYYDITIDGGASKLYLSENEKLYNEALGDRRVAALKKLVVSRLTAIFGATVANELAKNNIKTVKSTGSLGNSEEGAEADNMHNKLVKQERRADVNIARNLIPVEKKEQIVNQKQKEDVAKIKAQIQVYELELKQLKTNIKENIYNERSKAVLNSFEASSKNEFYPAFHSQTPEDFHRRLTFLQQCTRQGAAKRYDVVDENGELRARNSVFGKQPICVLRVGDFFYTKVVIDSVTIDYNDTTWDMNPEGFGMQPMIANVTLQMKLMGGQSLSGPIDALQNAVSFNYYANSNFTDKGMYGRPSDEANKQASYINGVTTNKQNALLAAYKLTDEFKVREGEK